MSAEWPDSWQVMPLQDAMEAIIDYRGKTPRKSESGIPLITAKIVKNGRIEEPSEFIPEELYDDWMVRGLPEIGDVVVTTEAPLGEVAQLSDSNVALAQRIVTLRGKKGLLDNDFLLFLMQSKFIQEQLEARASGSTVKGIKQSELRKVSLPLPPIDEQVEIARHLKALDDKIELNRQINQTLEQIAQTIFKSWFVDFEPVKAKIEAKAAGRDPERAAMCAISGKLEPELDQLPPEQYQQLAAIAALFPDELVESELGLIPVGWEVGTLADLCVLNAKSWGAKTMPAQVHYVDLANTKNGEISEVQLFSSVEAPSRARRVLSSGDTIVGTVRPGNRSFAFIGSSGQILTGSTGFAVLSPKKEELREIVYILATGETNIDRLTRLADGAAYPAVRPEVVVAEVCVIPSAELSGRFHRVAGPIFDQKLANAEENETFVTLRDTLLPKLLSGELTAGECEQQAEACS